MPLSETNFIKIHRVNLQAFHNPLTKGKITMTMGMWLAVVLGVAPLVGWLLWWWNDIWYCLVIATLQGTTKLPPGHMGLPFIGEMFTFLWYFKFLRRPDDYINSKRRKYGRDELGMYRTHLFGRQTVIAFLPSTIKFVLRADESFKMEWPNVELIGKGFLGAVHGKAHTRLKSFVSRSANQPDALRRIALVIQPRIISGLQSWVELGEIVSYKEVRKVTFENIGMYFASFQPGPILDKLDEYFVGWTNGFRCYPLNIPGTKFYHAIQCRRKASAIFKQELEKRKKSNDGISNRPINDLMDGLMNLKDEEGSQLSDMEVLDNILGIIVDAFETTSLAITWAIYYLAKYPNVLQKLRDENMSLKKSKCGELVTSEEIFKLKYTIKVVDETLRMANLAVFALRQTTKDVKYEGYTIPKGWNVLVWLRYLHTDANNFDDPMCFNPDRWDVSIEPGCYQVFSGGSRACVGNMLARLQIAMFLHYLSTGYKWKLMNPDAKVRYLPHPRPEDGVEIIVEKL